jgi:hypothetical protein
MSSSTESEKVKIPVFGGGFGDGSEIEVPLTDNEPPRLVWLGAWMLRKAGGADENEFFYQLSGGPTTWRYDHVKVPIELIASFKLGIDIPGIG